MKRIAIFALAGAASLAAVAAADMPYRLTATITGSLLPQEIVRSSMPFDGRYDDLTPGQKAVLASDYDNLPAGDEPPYPLYGLRHMMAPIVQYADLAAPVGPLVASVMVNSEGQPSEVVVYRSPNAEATRLVSAALMFEHYKPAVCHGQPCKMAYVLRLDFPQRSGKPITTSAMGQYDRNSHSVVGD